MLAALLVFVACTHPVLFDYDLWYDLAMGRHIVDTGTVPHQGGWVWPNDTLPAPWFANDEWGFCVASYAVHQAFGEEGLSLLLTALPASICILLGAVAARHRRAPWWAVGTAAALGVLLLQPRLMPRPQLVTDMLLAAFVLLGEGPRRRFWMFPAIMLAWCNLHAGCFIGIVYLGLQWIGTWLSQLRGGTEDGRAQVRALAAALAASLLATCACPSGPWLAVYFVDHVLVHNFGVQIVAEWAPPALGWTPLTAFLALAAAGLAAGRVRGRIEMRDIAVVAFFATLACRHGRASGELVAACLDILAVGLAALIPETGRLQARLGRVPAVAWQAVAAVALAIGLIWLVPQRLPLRACLYTYPDEAIAFLHQRRLPERVFNTFHFGGYLVWRAMPGHRPFIHGLNPTYSDLLYDDYITVSAGGAKAREVLDRWKVSCLLVGYGEPGDITHQLLSWLQADPRWKLVYWDDTALVYVPRTETFRHLPSYDIVRPGDASAWTPNDPRALDELRRAARTQPSVLALCWLGDALLARGDAAGAEAAWKQALTLDDGHPMPHSRIGRQRVAAGDLEGGRKALLRAYTLRRDASDAYNLAVLEVRLENREQAVAWVEEALRVDPSFAPARALAGRLGLSLP